MNQKRRLGKDPFQKLNQPDMSEEKPAAKVMVRGDAAKSPRNSKKVSKDEGRVLPRDLPTPSSTPEEQVSDADIEKIKNEIDLLKKKTAQLTCLFQPWRIWFSFFI